MTWLESAVREALVMLGNQPETLLRWIVEDYRRMHGTVVGSVGAQARMDGIEVPNDVEITEELWRQLRELAERAPS